MRAPACLLLAAFLASSHLRAAEYQGGATSKVVLKTTTTVTGDSVVYPKAGQAEVTASTVEIAPGGSTGWHRHAVPVYAWVVAGTLAVDYEGGRQVTVETGEALVEAVGTAHNGRNAGAGPLKLLVITTGVSGTPSVESCKAPAASDPLAQLRLLPAVLFEGDPGFSLAERMRHHKVEAVSVALVRGSRVAWTAAAGLADREEGRRATPETLFQAGSISKPVAAAGILRKAQEGSLRLDADVNTYLKSWKVPDNEWTAMRKVSLELLLSHGAGLTVHGFPGYAPGKPLPTVPQILDGAPPANTGPVRVTMPPGGRWRYSGGGYTVAQLAMEDTFGTPFPDLMRGLVLGPTGMARSTFEQPLPAATLSLAAAGYRADGSPVAGKRHTYPEMAAAGLWTSAGDLARFGVAVQAALRGDPGAFLSKEMATRMVTPFTGEHGLGFGTETHGPGAYFVHGGADEGFQAVFVMRSNGGDGAVVMTNSDNGIRLATEIVRGLARENGWEGYLPDPLKPVKLAPEALGRLPGRYRMNGDEALSIEVRGGAAFGTASDGVEFELVPIGEGLFARRDRETRYSVEASDGTVTAVTIAAGKERVVAGRMAKDARLPSDLLAQGRLGEAAAAYHALFAEAPSDPGVAERRLNLVGYRLAARREYEKAITVLKVSAELYPLSANAHDSLGEVHGLAGEKAQALACYRKVLEVLPRDAGADAAAKEQLRRNAEAMVERLGGR